MSSSDPETDITACLVNLIDLLDEQLALRELIKANDGICPKMMLPVASDEIFLARLARKYRVVLHNDFGKTAQEVLVSMTLRFVELASELKSLHDDEVQGSPTMQAFLDALGGEELTNEEFAGRHPSWFALSRVTGG